MRTSDTHESSNVPSAGDLHGRVVVLTGGAQGIGRALAEGFAAAGAVAVVADLDGDKARAVAESLGARSSWAKVDVGLEDSVSALVDDVMRHHGRVDVIVNGAAIFSTLKMKPFDQISLREWNQVLNVNVTGSFLCCKAVAPLMRRAGFGRIINIASSAARMGRPNYLHYIASKGALEAMTRSMARELGEYGITVNAICPGAIFTEIPRETVSDKQKAQIVASQCVPRPGAPQDLVSTALHLASPASAFVTGQSFIVDGGVVHG